MKEMLFWNNFCTYLETTFNRKINTTPLTLFWVAMIDIEWKAELRSQPDSIYGLQ